MQRLINSARSPDGYSLFARRALRPPEIGKSCAKSHAECYLKPIVMRGYGEVGVKSLAVPRRGLHGVLGLGQVLGAEAAGKWRGRLRQLLDAHGPPTRSRRCPKPPGTT